MPAKPVPKKAATARTKAPAAVSKRDRILTRRNSCSHREDSTACPCATSRRRPAWACP